MLGHPGAIRVSTGALKWPKTAPKWPKMAQNHPNDSKWHCVTPNGPKTLQMGILHDYMSCWSTLGPFQRPTGAPYKCHKRLLKRFMPGRSRKMSLQHLFRRRRLLRSKNKLWRRVRMSKQQALQSARKLPRLPGSKPRVPARLLSRSECLVQTDPKH